MAGVLQITLERDGHDQPWGFRLQGGYDVGIPLSIQRVLVGTPAEGVLKKGDVLQKIGTHDVKLLSHQQAADLFTNTGNTIQIFIKRPSAFTTQPAHNVNAHQVVAPPQHVPISGGVALPGLTTITTGRSSETLLSNLSKSRMAPSVSPLNSQPHRTTSPSVPLTIQNQPYRTTQLIQPSAKIEIGPGSAQHLKMQADYITGAKESQISQDSQQARAAEFTMKQKVRSTQHSQQQQQQQQQPSSGSERKLEGKECFDANYSKEPWHPDNCNAPHYPVRKSQFKESASKFRITEKDICNPRTNNASHKDISIAKMGKFVFMIGGEIVELKQIPQKKKRLSDPGKQLERDLRPLKNKPIDEFDHSKMGRLSLQMPDEFNLQFLAKENHIYSSKDIANKSKTETPDAGIKSKKADALKTKEKKIDKCSNEIPKDQEKQNKSEITENVKAKTVKEEVGKLLLDKSNPKKSNTMNLSTKKLPQEVICKFSGPKTTAIDPRPKIDSKGNLPSHNDLNTTHSNEGTNNKSLKTDSHNCDSDRNEAKHPLKFKSDKDEDDQSISFTIKLKNNLPKPIITYESINVHKTVQIQNRINR